ncbi:helix-turn-helix domain protein [[Leptolyngbya] sp. PCC 7376]|uniref:ImmA/IrrE family metallo-endopeptidase n=1 Tax=[Leptolyngbya] sp. PCC 7376 TaxID=111781 RepID=UPI00029EEE2B|nr:XRE family transcriptional regulator [[Leptolyngbya] sp. PCC 7376]AFY39868.1 helix-turn-helix domain protein [[Leptolyngbya] sp. PCC 7376]
MARSIKALINPVMLKYGRESLGLSVGKVAGKLGISNQNLIDWEEGIDNPSLSTFEKLAKLYKRHTVFFYLPNVPNKCKRREADFRTFPRYHSTPQPSLEFLHYLKDVYRRQAIALELLEELEEKSVPRIPASHLHENPEDVAARLRLALNIISPTQFRWDESYQALSAWISAVEKLGILVFKSSHAKVPLEEMRGLAIWDESLPAIALNASDTDNGKIFTLMHELAHLSLHKNGVWGLHENLSGSASDIEVFCNHVAGAILVPNQALTENPVVIPLPSDCDSLSDDDIRFIARKFCVSGEVILRRLLISGKISQSFYEEKCKYLRSLPISKRGGGGNSQYAKKIVSREGSLFPNIVLRAMFAEKIPMNKASSYLNTKVKHFGDLEALVL